MVKFLVGILCSSNIRLLHESFNSVIHQKNFDDYEIYIVVNTRNEQFYEDVMREFGYHAHSKLKKIVRTESNGYPGKGHNSVLYIFRAENIYENLVMLDGDDFFFPYTLERINNVKNEKQCDVITLSGNAKIRCISASFEKTTNNSGEQVHCYNMIFNYDIYEPKNIKNIHPDYNEVLATPYRLLCTNRKILDKYEKLYDERMYLYDDFMYTIILYKECKCTEFNVLHLSDQYIYLYNATIQLLTIRLMWKKCRIIIKK